MRLVAACVVTAKVQHESPSDWHNGGCFDRASSNLHIRAIQKAKSVRTVSKLANKLKAVSVCTKRQVVSSTVTIQGLLLPLQLVKNLPRSNLVGEAR